MTYDYDMRYDNSLLGFFFRATASAAYCASVTDIYNDIIFVMNIQLERRDMHLMRNTFIHPIHSFYSL